MHCFEYTGTKGFYENRVYSRESIIETMHDYQSTKLIFSFTSFAEGPDFGRLHARCSFLVVVGIFLPSMPRFYSCPLGSCRRSPASCCCAGALDLPLLVLLLVFRIKFQMYNMFIQVQVSFLEVL